MSKKKSEFVSTKEAAKLLGVSKSRVDQFAQTGRLPSLMVGNARVFRRADVELFGKVERKSGPKGKNS